MLFIVGTPIGNKKDISYRQAETICTTDILLAEDTRSARALIASISELFGMKPDPHLEIISYYKEKEMEKLPLVMNNLTNNKKVTLISESGMPLLSDPGLMLLKSVIREKIPYTVIPGPSAAVTGYVHAASSSQEFMYMGFLPKKTSQKKQILEYVMRVKDSFPKMSCICFESPQRITDTLELIKQNFSDLHIVICREMTKKHEEILRGSADEILEQLGDEVKGEITMIAY